MNSPIRSTFALATLVLVLSVPCFAQNAELTTRYDSSGMLSLLDVEQPSTYRPGSRIFITVRGEPGSKVTATIKTRHGDRVVPLLESDRGLYEGHYTLKPYDSTFDFDRASFQAKLEKRGRVGEASATLSSRFGPDDDHFGRDGRWDSRQPPSSPLVAEFGPANCQRCGVVSAVRVVEEGSSEANNAPGIIIGGVLGAVLGNQVGRGSGRSAATVLGALGGGYAGNEIGKNQNKNKHSVWLIDVRLYDGSTQTFRNDTPPQVTQGQRVRIDNNQLYLLDH